ncbi:pyocin knob domain-containing protein [Bacillus cytotoxicus]|uniref:pyocin knob domain-containing protein n=1 Tax=Bacillus cytotoxicus TaxID=580165 RepID=UPI003B82BCF3
MPEFTERLKLPLPLGNEYVKREMSNNIFKEIDKKVATLEECNMVLSDAKKYVDNNWKQKYKVTQDDGRPIEVSKKSFNEIQQSGYYMGYGMNDAPLPNPGNWWFIEIMRHATGWVHQRATWFNTTTVETYERILHNNTWQPWKKTVTSTGWGDWRTNGGRDLLCENKRALVGLNTTGGDQLIINYGNDFKNGVDLQGRLTNDGKPVLHTGYNLMKDLDKEIRMQDDWNTIISTGIYRVSTDVVNPVHPSAPKGAYPYGTLEIYQASNGSHVFQRYTSHERAEVWIRAGWEKGKWSAWRKLADENTLNSAINAVTNKAQMQKITTDAGGVTISVSDTSKNILDEIIAKGLGMNTIYCKGGVQGNTPKDISWRGISHINSDGYGYVIAKDYHNNLWTNYFDHGKWLGWVQHASIDDVNKVQTKKITNDNGSQTISVVDSSQNILNEILAKGAGLNTIYCNGGVQGQTPANVSWRGISFLNQSDIGFVLAKDYKGNFWTNYINGKHGWLGWTEHPNSEQVIDEINKRTEDGVPSRSGKDENGIYTVYEEAQEDGKLRKKSVLSNPDADGNYLVRTVTYYENGVAYKTMVFDLKYDEDGDFIKAVPRK